MNLEELRQQLPELTGLDDAQAVDAIQGAYYPDMPREQIAKALGVKPVAPPAPEATWGDRISDTGVGLAAGGVAAAQGVVGIGDLATGGRVGKAVEDAGLDLKGASDYWQQKYSPAQQAANLKVQNAEGLWDTFKEAVKNPSVVYQSVLQSLPSMAAGGVLSRLWMAGRLTTGALARLATMAPEEAAAALESMQVTAGAIGEGAVQAFQQAEQGRADSPDGLMDGKQYAAALGSGVGDTLIAKYTGHLAAKMGLADPQTMMAGAAVNARAAKHIVRSVIGGAFEEGFMQELPQSVQEQVWQNYAANKPLDEGVNQQAVLGALSGALLGGGANLLNAARSPAAPQAPVAPAVAAPAAPTPGDVLNAPTVDDAINTAMAAVAPSIAAIDPAALIAGTGNADLMAAARERQPGGMIGAGIEPGTNDALLAAGRTAFEDQRQDALGDQQVADMRAQAEREAQSLRQYDPLTLPRKGAPTLDETIQPGDILTPKTGAPFTEAAAKLKLKSLRQSGKNAELVPVAEGGYLLRPITRGATNEADTHIDGSAGRTGQPAAGTAGATGSGVSTPAAGPIAPAEAARGEVAAAPGGGQAGLVSPDGAVAASPGRPVAAAQDATGPGAVAAPAPVSDDGRVASGALNESARTEAAAPAAAPLPAVGQAQRQDAGGDGAAGQAGADVAGEPAAALSPAERWNGMTPQQRSSALDRTVAKGKSRARVMAAQWDALEPGWHRALARAMDEVSRETSAPTSQSSAMAAPQRLFVQRGNQRFEVASLADASAKWAQFRDTSGGGASELGSNTKVVDQDGKEVASISYNGRVWPPGGYKPGAKPLLEAGESTAASTEEQPRDAESGQFVAEPATVKREDRLMTRQEALDFLQGNGRILKNAGTEYEEEVWLDREPKQETWVVKSREKGSTATFTNGPLRERWSALVAAERAVEGMRLKDSSSAAFGSEKAKERSREEGSHYAAGRDAFLAGEPRILPSYFTVGNTANAKAWYRGWDKANIAAPLSEEKPAAPVASSNTVFTDDMAEKARSRLKAKLGRVGSGIDPETMLDGITLAGWHLEKGARTFAAFARAMVEDLGDAVKPYLKSWYSALRYDPRASAFAGSMSSAAMVDEFDLADVSAPSDRQTAQPGDTHSGERDGNGTSTRSLDSTGPGPSSGEPSEGIRAPASERPAVPAPEGSGGRGGAANAEPAGAADSVPGRVGAGAGAAVPASRAQRGADAGERRVPRAPRSGQGPGLFDDAGREGPAAVNPAPNAPPIAAPQLTAQQLQDFTIEDDFALGEGGQKTKFRANIEAIRLAQQFMADPQRVATADEQRTLARYVGWGGLSQAFDAEHKDWGKEHAELKELLTPEEFDAARRSTRYAHYTSRQIIQDGIYAAMDRFGFAGGRVLEGGAGVGNFIGLMPTAMRSAGRVTAIEREPLAATIARVLYPMQNVQQADFTEFKGQDGYFDAAVGNPPFASDSQVDRSGRKHLNGLSLHNYFFAKEVDMLRDGGILAQVVSNYFMDAAEPKTRKYIGERTRLLGAIRLPNNAFAKNANTEVTTDLIFLQKLPEAEWGTKKAKEAAREWLEVMPYTDPRKPAARLQLNRYFVNHPEMMLGDFGANGTMYGPDNAALVARPGQDTGALLREAVAKLPEKVYQPLSIAATASAIDAAVKSLSSPPVQEGGYFNEGGKLMQRLPDIAGEALGKEITPATRWTAKTTLGDDGFDRIKRLADMRTTLRGLLSAELASDKKMDGLRATLNQQYDDYVKVHGLVNDRGTARVFDDDPDFPLLLSLEHSYVPPIGPGEAKKLGIKPVKSRADKAPIFRQRVVESRQQVRKVETPADALAVSMAERGHLDAAYIGELLGKSADDVLREMTEGDSPHLFLDPATNEYALRDAYLSGNVRAKLAQAKEAGMHGNVRALENVQPEDVPAHQISAKIGAPWVPTDVYEAFARELLGANTHVSINYMKLNSSYAVYVHGAEELNERNKWGTPEYKASELLSALLNNRTIRVTDTDAQGRTITLQEPTERANTKAQEIKDRFGDWLFSDPQRSELLTRAYNDTNNNYVTRRYDGSWMTFPGKVPDSVIAFRRHQRDAIARMVQDRTVLLDHVVGAGKTFAMASAAMELRRTGLAKKPMIAVPNHLVKQWAADFYRLYPGANILTATKKDFDKLMRRRFLAKAATGDWDAVIIAHSSFGFIQPGAEFESTFNQKQIDLIKEAIDQVQESDAEKPQKRRTVKQLEAMTERLEKRIQRLRDKPMDALLDFEELGVDQLFVDEAHLFKNLMFTTKLQNVAGLGDSQGSQRAYDMYVKTQQVMDKNGRSQGVVFATGTPVSNSLAEKYHMMRYLMPQQMESMGFQSFDAWANTFAEVNQVWMQKPSGDGFKAQNRMSTFVNVPELLKLFDQVADTVTMEDIKKAYKEENGGKEFPIPPLKTGRRQPVSLEKSPAQAAYMEEIAQRARVLEARKGPPQKGEDNILVLMTDARKAAMDIRLVDPDITTREPGGRIDRSAQEIVARWKQWAHVKGTQLVFSDLGTPIKHARTELKEYENIKARIDAADDDVRARAALGSEEAQAIVDASEDAETELEAKGPDWLTAVKAALRGFSVYDDLKAALIERGIPPEHIAFIHDYNTDEQKAGLFRKVNAGDIRVLLGSTQKMGAGTNVQERVIAEHHLDVPWRPSDVEQREGRVLRQGNRLYDEVPKFEVEILAYVTKDTLDMRMWQIQEVKLKLINQLRSRQIERDIDNAFEDMEMSAGEMQAAATGNMDLLHEIQARNDIKKLEQKRRSFEAQKNDLIGRKRSAAQKLERLPAAIAQAEREEKLGQQYRKELDEQAAKFKVDIDGKTYTNPAEASKYLLEKTEARHFTRTVDKDGKKEREELSAADYQKLADRVKQLRADGKPEDDKELAAAVHELTSWKEQAAPLDVTMNGEQYSARARLAEAFSALRGDRDPILWKDGGKEYARRTAAALALEPRVADALADEKVESLGSVGPFAVTVEGQPRDKKGLGSVEIVLRADGTQIDGSLYVRPTDTPHQMAEAIIDWADRHAKNAGSNRQYLVWDMEAAQRQQAELNKTEDMGAWPGQQQLENARAKHQDILKRLSAAGAKAQGSVTENPEFRQGDTSTLPANARRIGELQQLVDSVTEDWARPLPATVVSSVNSPSVPTAIQLENARRVKTGKGAGKAVIYQGQVWVFADRIRDEQDLLTSIYHEVLGHAGLRGRFGKGLDQILSQVSVLNRDDVRAMMERTGLKDEKRAAEEVLAYLAQTKPELTLVQRAIAAIRSFLRERVPGFANMQFSDAELIRNFILPARRHIEDGGPRGGQPIDASPAFNASAPTYYSALSRELSALPSKSLPAAGWDGAINALLNKAKIKADEVEWSGVKDWLALQSGKVTKDEVLDFLRDNGVQVHEVTHGGMQSKGQAARARDVVVKLDALGYDVSYDLTEGLRYVTRRSDGRVFFPERGGRFKTDAFETEHDGKPEESLKGQARIRAKELDDIVNPENPEFDGQAEDGTKYGQYTLPGGNNYREVLLTMPGMPGKQAIARKAVFDSYQPRLDALRKTLDAYPHGETPTAEYDQARRDHDALLRQRDEEARLTAGERADYRSSHWDESNVLAHIRLNDRTDAEGKKVLFVEELQSDWAQAGRKNGFADTQGLADATRAKDAENDRYQRAVAANEKALHSGTVEEIKATSAEREDAFQAQIAAQRAFREKSNSGGTPTAPFVTSTDAWVSLALKRIIKMAVDEGYDKVAFVNGKQSADRYDLSKQIESIKYAPVEGGFRVEVYPKGRNQHWTSAGMPHVIEADKLADYVGKEVAQKIIDGAGETSGPDKTTRYLHKLDLQVGGQGMIAFYDKIVPAAANKLLAKLGGGKVAPIQFKGGAAEPQRTNGGHFASGPVIKPPMEQPGFDITDKMRETAGEGLPMFQQGEPRTVQVDGTRRPIENAAGQPIVANHDVEKLRNFWRWFGASKVVDEQGKPLVVYHGTASDISSFDNNLGGGNTTSFGFYGAASGYFTASKAMAEGYAMGNPDRTVYPPHQQRPEFMEAGGERGKVGANVMPVYVSMKNPLRIERMSALDKIVRLPGSVATVNDWHAMGKVAAKSVTAAIRALGYDGVIVGNFHEVVPFSPEQIKSATGNAGTFDANNPDIAFQQEGVLGPNDPRNYKQVVREALGELGSTPGKLHWWHKSIGTQYNLAQKSPAFARVFNSVQDFLSDVSVYASEAANQAPALLPKLEKLKDIAKTPLSAADTRAIERPINEGTLAWTRVDGNPVKVDDLRSKAANLDPNEMGDLLVAHKKISPNVLAMWRGLPIDQFQQNVTTAFNNRMYRPGIVWTDTELERMFGLNDKQRGYYREFRKAVDKSITDLSVSDMLRYAGEDGKAVRADVLGAGDIGAAAAILRAHLMDLSDENPERNKVLTATIDKVLEKADRAQTLIDEGYAPLSRFGHYTVDVVGADGERLFFSLYESRFEAMRAAKALAQEFPEAMVNRGTISQEEYKLFAGVSPETIELFGEMLGLDSTGDSARDAAFQSYLKLAKATRSSMKRMIHRKGVAGFSQDVGRVLAGFVYSNARMTSRNLHAGEIEQAITEIPKGQGELKDHAVRMRDYVNNPVEEGQALKGLLFAQYLGGSIAAALVNMTQPFTMTLPYLSQFGGIKTASGHMRDALKVAWAKTTGDAALDQALARATEDGIVAPQEVHQLIAQSAGRGALQSGDGTKLGDAAAAANNALARLTLAWGKPFSTAELFNRRVTFVAAWKSAKERKLTDAAAFKFAENAVTETQGLYNKGNRPRWARGIVGATAMTFKQFSIAYLEMIERMWNAGEPGSEERAAGRRAVYFAMGILLLAGGSGGLPFAEDVSDLVDGVMQRLGYNWSTKQKRQEMLDAAFGRGLGHFLDKGVSGLPGVPIDVAGRLGLGNLIPATGALQKKTDRSGDMLELLGPTADLAKRVVQAGDTAAAGRGIDAGMMLSPMATRNLAKAIEMAATGQYKDQRGYKVMDVDAGDVASKAIGFQPSAVARVQEADRETQNMVALAKLRESEIAGDWAKAISQGSAGEGAVAARESIASWNEKNPDTPIRIKLGDVLKRAKNMQMDRATRIEKSAPHEIRETVRQRLRDE